MVKILKEQRLKGSTTDSGYVVGDRPAVCFQDAPPSAIIANGYYEMKLRREGSPLGKDRYNAAGLSFSKPYAFRKGARPVVYDRTDDAKMYLGSNEHWRIVNLDHSTNDDIVDWTHEREWRAPDEFVFERSEATLLIGNRTSYGELLEELEANGISPEEFAGIVTLQTVLF